MNVVYNSDNYYVVEFADRRGFELVDKHTRRSTFFQGDVAEKFAQSMNGIIAEDASTEHVDDFLGNFDVLMAQPLVLH
ncbi:MAG: DUF3567 domain-containing protein [Betaproteobacteria bacterium]|nr:DUF3567 domain-containing protein [Betaproteobacteria bacterium]